MSRQVPAYRRHRNGQAFIRTVRLNNGKNYYLGVYGSPESYVRYQEILKRLTAGPSGASSLRQLLDEQDRHTVACFLAAYIEHARDYYSTPDGRSWEFQEMVYALQPLLSMFGSMQVDDLRPRHLVEIQGALIAQKIARSTINHRISRIKRAFRWGSKTGVVPPGLYHELTCVDGLRYGRSGARETEKIEPVPLDVVRDTLSWLTPTTATMVQVHFLCGMRSQDVCQMRLCDIDLTGEVWIYRPGRFKTKHLGQKRVIAIPAVAQELLLPFLKREALEYLFSPLEAVRQKHEAMRTHSERTSQVYPSELLGSKNRSRRSRATRVVGLKYNHGSYRNAVNNAIKRAAKNGVVIPHWHPHQLRHAIATFVSSRLGPREAQYYVGHKRLETTKIYDSLQLSDLVAIAKQINEHFDVDLGASTV